LHPDISNKVASIKVNFLCIKTPQYYYTIYALKIKELTFVSSLVLEYNFD
jgi:hypothetical protein